MSGDGPVALETATDEEAVWRLATALASSLTPLAVAEVSVREGRIATGAASASMAVLDGDSGLARLVRQATSAGSMPTSAISPRLDAQLPSCAAVRTGLPVLLGSPEEIAHRYPAVAGDLDVEGLRALASMPLYAASGAALGAVEFGWAAPQSFTAGQLRRLDLVGQLAGLALERALGSPGAASAARPGRGVETMPKAFLTVDSTLRVTFVNAEAEELLGVTPNRLLGEDVLAVFPDAPGSELELRYRGAIATSRPTSFEAYFERWQRWFEVQLWPDGHGLNVAFSDITGRRRLDVERAAALSSAEEANRRLRLSTELATTLTGAQSRDDVLERLTHAAIPALADWCTVVVPEGEKLVRVAALHRDAALDGLAKRLVGSYPHPFDGPSPGVVVYRSGQPLRLDRLAQEIIADLDDSAASAAYGRTLQLLGDGPGLITPIKSGDEVVAILTMVRSGGTAFSDADVDLLGDLAGRVSRALDEAQHLENQRDLAGALQAAALPKSLPTSERVTLAAGYRAASEGSQVGGDWYDAFALQTGHIALVVGDAAGHGVQAAAVMAQLRNALRADLFASAGPADALMRLSSFLSVQEPDAFATIICADVDPLTGELVWASAGHLAPILVTGGATSSYLRGRPAPPVGWACATSLEPPREHRLSLEPGDRLLLFTDGLLERRGIHLDIGLTHLMILAEQTYLRPDPAEACEAILADILRLGHEDDVCLMIAQFE